MTCGIDLPLNKSDDYNYNHTFKERPVIRNRHSAVVSVKLPAAFFRRRDVIQISRDLLGQYLFTRLGRSGVTGGRIVETEAYAGATDRASHAYGNRRTRRTAVMYVPGGVAYIYLCYGLHALFNIITGPKGIPHAVLIRALEPTHGLAVMLRRRRKEHPDRTLTAGPGALAQALGLSVHYSGASLLGNKIWLEKGIDFLPKQVVSTTRVGVDYAGSDARRPWRFLVRDSAWTSSAK
ncbi:MAG: DNA-3-methyladenine glycosylase [Lentisphaerae bacterium]|nr:DNA-3-methyladenine glycosylase [Lentisphaerota bacterium]